MKRFVVLVVLVVAAAALFGACSSDKVNEPFRDAPRTNVTNSAGADVIEMPDGFSNAATKCDHGNRIYVAFKGDSNRAAIAVVAQDPTCHGNSG